MSKAASTRRGSPRIKVMPAACIATSVPPPSGLDMAIPTSDAAKAGASFTPSPTMATVCALPPWAAVFKSRTRWALSPGKTPASTSALPSLASSPRRTAMALAAPQLSPEIMTTCMPLARRPAIACCAPALGSSLKPMQARTCQWPSCKQAKADTLLPWACSARACTPRGEASKASPPPCNSSIQGQLPKA